MSSAMMRMIFGRDSFTSPDNWERGERKNERARQREEGFIVVIGANILWIFLMGEAFPQKWSFGRQENLLACREGYPVAGRLPATGFCDSTNRGNQGNIAYEAGHPGSITKRKPAQ